MTKRKETPDVLDEIFGSTAITAGMKSAEPDELMPLTPPKPARAQRSGSGTTKAAAPKPAAPRQWEYLLVSFQNYHGWRPRFHNGSELTDWSAGPLIHDYLAQVAEVGWELAAASSGRPMYALSDVHQLYFKRPKTG